MFIQMVKLKFSCFLEICCFLEKKDFTFGLNRRNWEGCVWVHLTRYISRIREIGEERQRARKIGRWLGQCLGKKQFY